MIVKTHNSLKKQLKSIQLENKTIGFVPTMGALHKGHLSLMQQAVNENDALVVSIFVNPTQFNNQDDLEKYPRTIEKDYSLIKKEFNDAAILVYTPSVQDVYGENVHSKSYQYDGLEKVMEGANRPGHFDGVGTILEFLFKVVSPDKAYFGEKDFQQLQIVKKLVQKLKLNVKVVGCPIKREPNGLAMSSRNERLSSHARHESQVIFQTLQRANDYLKNNSISSTINMVNNIFENLENFELEYFTINRERDLKPAIRKSKNTALRAFIVVHVEGVRLIDNLALDL
ncbi:pantoate--beta-alanine ligase [Nonlabens tegetincola]|uniref:pantoate--beta-alanine ligase n=1 Tax=Nonlabens tegetincola TaxID=323273 RepID=UPI000CF3E55B|nr:pantoate--beta-alanine ligase [Nonlabens tegetincola]PQJ20575.1 pantoate--beta-alanine ligase [Nonlabens tegetincola]